MEKRKVGRPRKNPALKGANDLESQIRKSVNERANKKNKPASQSSNVLKPAKEGKISLKKAIKSVASVKSKKSKKENADKYFIGKEVVICASHDKSKCLIGKVIEMSLKYNWAFLYVIDTDSYILVFDIGLMQIK